MKYTDTSRKAAFLYILVTAMLTVLLLTGCGEDTEIDTYKTNMDQFFETVRTIDYSINALADHADSETATQDLLQLLDTLDTTFSQMASLEVPEGFPGVEELADEASEYMSAAVTFYHQAYDGEYNATLRDVADQNYERANARFQYIVSIIHGNIPEEIYTYEDDSEEKTEEKTEEAPITEEEEWDDEEWEDE